MLPCLPAKASSLNPAEKVAVRLRSFDSARIRKVLSVELEAPDHDKSYLRNTLWFLAVASVVAFGAILTGRPKKSERT